MECNLDPYSYYEIFKWLGRVDDPGLCAIGFGLGAIIGILVSIIASLIGRTND